MRVAGFIRRDLERHRAVGEVRGTRAPAASAMTALELRDRAQPIPEAIARETAFSVRIRRVGAEGPARCGRPPRPAAGEKQEAMAWRSRSMASRGRARYA